MESVEARNFDRGSFKRAIAIEVGDGVDKEVDGDRQCYDTTGNSVSSLQGTGGVTTNRSIQVVHWPPETLCDQRFGFDDHLRVLCQDLVWLKVEAVPRQAPFVFSSGSSMNEAIASPTTASGYSFSRQRIQNMHRVLQLMKAMMTPNKNRLVSTVHFSSSLWLKQPLIGITRVSHP